jgi:hypothetical protein
MGKRRWTTPEQRAWLEELIPDFVQAQQDKSVRSFLDDTYAKWHKEWPTPPPAAEEVRRTKGNAEKMLTISRKAEESVRTNKSSIVIRLPGHSSA